MRKSTVIGANTIPPSREQQAVYAFREDCRKRNINIFTGAGRCLAPGVIVLWCKLVNLETREKGQPWYDVLVSLDEVAVDSHHIQLPPEGSMLEKLNFAYIHLGFHDRRPRYNKVREALEKIVTGQPGKYFGWFSPIQKIPDYDFSDLVDPIDVVVAQANPVVEFDVKAFMDFLRERQTNIGFIARQKLRISSLFRRGRVTPEVATNILPQQLHYPLHVYLATVIADGN